MRGKRGTLLWTVTALWLLAPAALAAIGWPRWWSLIAPELTPMTWLQSVVLVLAAASSLMLAYVAGRTQRSTLPWWLLAVGFSALSFDERFALHERVRDGFLAPAGITVPFLPWVAPGDFLVLAMALVGLAVLPVVWRAMSPEPLASRALLVGVLLAVVAVATDSIDPATWSVSAERVQQSLEEVIELGSGLALLTSVLCRLLGLLDEHLQPAGVHEKSERLPSEVDDEVAKVTGPPK